MSPGELSELARKELDRINAELEGLKPKKRAKSKKPKEPEMTREEKIKFVINLGFSEEDAQLLVSAGEI